MLSYLYNFVCAFQHPEIMPGDVQPVINNIDQTVKFVFESFRDRTNLDDTEGHCIANLNLIVLQLMDAKDLFDQPDAIPMVLLMSQSPLGKVSDQANLYLKSYCQEMDRNDAQIVSQVFRLLKNENIFKDIAENGQQAHMEVLIEEGQADGSPGLPMLT